MAINCTERGIPLNFTKYDNDALSFFKSTISNYKYLTTTITSTSIYIYTAQHVATIATPESQ
jgi:hypothetical protein